ncbi:MAG: type II toxin-antitoxin system HigB family toxin [Flavobacteriaceae bacterium]|jgi:mRNA interferase HigB|nr:type II toxin-antitoxin system HigB family toxin [Flavobacteriaceae bacterium]
MKVLVKRTIHYYINKYPAAEKSLLLWEKEFSKLTFQNFNEIKKVYGNASIVGNGRVVFNIKGNDYRLVVSVNFRQQACYIIWFGTHKEYDKIDVETISYDINIDNYKRQ